MNKVRDFIAQFYSSPGKKTVVENFALLSILQIANYILPLITLPYLIRVLGPAKFGLIAFAQAAVQYFNVFTEYGFNLSAPREISINRHDSEKLSGIFNSIIFIKLLFSLASFIIMIIIVNSFSRVRDEAFVYIFSLGTIVGNTLIATWFFQGMEKMKYITVLNLVSRLIFTVAIFVFIRNSSQYVYVPLINSSGSIIAGATGLFIIYTYLGIKASLPRAAMVIHQLKEGWHIFLSTIFISAYSNTRVFAVGLLTNNTITGLYAVAEKMIGIIQTSSLIPLVQAVYPRLSKIYSEEPMRSFEIMKKIQRYTTIAYFLFLPVIIITAPYIIMAVSGDTYRESILSLRVLSLAIFFTSANAFRVQFLLVSGQKKLFANIHVLAGIVGVLLTFLGAYYYSYVGPAVAFLLIEMMVMFMTVIAIRKKIDEFSVC